MSSNSLHTIHRANGYPATATSEYQPPPDHRDIQHDDTQHLAVNNTRLRRYLTLIALQTTARLFEQIPPCAPISKNYIVKRGPFVHLTEAATLQFVASKTSIPVPRVHCAFVHNNMAYIVMDRIQGEPIDHAWRSLSEAQLKKVFTQLRTMFTELRTIEPPARTGVESCVGGSLTDSRIPHARPRFRPFKTIQEFHAWLRKDFNPEDHPDREDQDWKDLKEMKAMHDGPWRAPVFTHGDLNLSNVFVRGDRVVGIIDWEFAGWYPHYWEYT